MSAKDGYESSEESPRNGFFAPARRAAIAAEQTILHGSSCFAISEAAVACLYEAKVSAFASLMRAELEANAHKGDGWLGADPDALLHDIAWHWAKLAMAWRERRTAEGVMDLVPFDERLREYAADVANMSLMFLDRLALIEAGEPRG